MQKKQNSKLLVEAAARVWFRAEGEDGDNRRLRAERRARFLRWYPAVGRRREAVRNAAIHPSRLLFWYPPPPNSTT